MKKFTYHVSTLRYPQLFSKWYGVVYVDGLFYENAFASTKKRAQKKCEKKIDKYPAAQVKKAKRLEREASRAADRRGYEFSYPPRQEIK